MSTQAGNLHFRRARLTLEAGDTIVDTLLEVADRAYNTTGSPSNPVDPPLGVTAASPGVADGTTPASRVMVIPEPPMASWDNITIGEPYVDSTTGRVNVPFTNSGGGGGCANVTLNIVFIDDGATDPPDYDVVEAECDVTLTITWDANAGVTQPTLAAAETALEAAGYTVSWAGTEGGTDFSPANFAVDPGNTWTVDVVCSDTPTWDLDNLSGPGLFGILVLPQPAEQPPNVLTGTVTADPDTFDCGAATVELNVLFWAPHTKCGPVKCDTYNAPIE